MSATVTVSVKDRGATEAVRELERELSPAKLQHTYGPRCKELTRDHLKRLPRNKRGWPSTKFWERAARATTWEPRQNGAIAVVVSLVGVRQRYLGGHIAPVKADALTIPISPLSYGKTVKDFPGSFLLRTKKGAYIVMATELGKGRRQQRRGVKNLRAALVFLFKLVDSVDQAPNPNVLPTPAEYRATVFAAARERLAGIKARKGGVTA